MRTGTKSVVLAALAIGMLGAASCEPPYHRNFFDPCKAAGHTEEQCKAQFADADRIVFSKEQPDHTYVVVDSMLSFDDVLGQLKKLLADFRELLDYKNKEGLAYIEFAKLRKPLEHQEEVIGTIHQRVLVAAVYVKFQSMMGEVSSEDLEHMKGYDPRKVFWTGDPTKIFPFTSDQIESAKKRGVLKAIEHYEFSFYRELDRKESDPAHPEDKNEFIWRHKETGLDLTNYKIIDDKKPDDNKGNYIEGHVVFKDKDGVAKKESVPRLKVFFHPNGGSAIIVIDSDREGKDSGFGLPDYVEQIGGILGAQDVVRNDEILGKLFQEKEKEKRIPPMPKKIFVEIAPLGGPVSVWQACAEDAGCDPKDGWLVPFKYWNFKKTNYEVEIKFKKSGHESDPSIIADEFRELEYIAKVWDGPGAVKEYFRPKKEFAGKVRAEVGYEDGRKKIHFVFQNGHEEDVSVTPGDNIVIETEPYAKDFTEGQKRWHLEKSKGSSVFDKRRELYTQNLQSSDASVDTDVGGEGIIRLPTPPVKISPKN